jgi:hypothetical protein
MQALKDTFFAVYRDLCETSSQVPRDLLAEPNPFTPARDHFPTAGDFLGYLMSAHLAYHLGQLGGWRAAAGLGGYADLTPKPRDAFRLLSRACLRWT